VTAEIGKIMDENENMKKTLATKEELEPLDMDIEAIREKLKALTEDNDAKDKKGGGLSSDDLKSVEKKILRSINKTQEANLKTKLDEQKRALEH
jgi:uncharacterized protein involved in exopolysaccharide biosynthesis